MQVCSEKSRTPDETQCDTLKISLLPVIAILNPRARPEKSSSYDAVFGFFFENCCVRSRLGLVPALDGNRATITIYDGKIEAIF
eukprot:4875510-Pleurochrysis_carterae.AAC.8